MNRQTYAEEFLGFCKGAGFLVEPAASAAIGDWYDRGISAPMAGALLIIQAISRDYLGNNPMQLVRSAEAALDTAKRLKTQHESGKVSGQEWHDASAMLMNLFEPSEAGAQFARSYLASFGDARLCHNITATSDPEKEVSKMMERAYEAYVRAPDPNVHAPINDFDLAAITNEVSNWKAHGKHADYDLSNKSAGVALLVLENIVAGDGSLMIFEIHKVTKSGFLRKKVGWIVQLHSSPSPEDSPRKHGCVSASTLVGAIREAHLDVKHGFMSIADFQLSLGAFLE